MNARTYSVLRSRLARPLLLTALLVLFTTLLLSSAHAEAALVSIPGNASNSDIYDLLLSSGGPYIGMNTYNGDLQQASQTVSSPYSNSDNVALAGQIGGAVSTVDVVDDYAYVGVGSRVIILDIGDPAAPIVVGKTAPLTGLVLDVVVNGNYAYVANGEGGMRIIDITNKSALTEVGHFDTPGSANDIALDESYAYISDYSGGLYIVDISNPDTPSETAFLDTPGFAQGVAVDASYAYVADDHLGLRVIDVSTPANPVEVGFYDTPGRAHDVAIAGEYAYVADGLGGIRIINVSVSASPVEVGYYDTSGYSIEVVLDGGFAYVADNHAGLLILEIANSASPTFVGSYRPGGFVVGLAISEGYAYLANNSRGLKIVDTVIPSSPTQAGSYTVSGTPTGLAIDGDYAYLAVANGGLRVIDIADPTNPTQVGLFDHGGYARNVAADGDFAYVASADIGLRILNIADPTNPFLISIWNTPGWAYDVAIAGGYAYIADWEGGLRIIDITNPYSPFEVGHFATAGDALDISVYGDYAYLGVGNDIAALRIIDVSDPSSPALVSSLEIWATGLVKDGDIGYLSGSPGLRTVDFSNLQYPQQIGSYTMTLSTQDVDLTGNHVHLATTWPNGYRIINVSDPADPTEVGYFETPGHALGVVADGSYAYVADSGGGLVIIALVPLMEVAPYQLDLVGEPGQTVSATLTVSEEGEVRSVDGISLDATDLNSSDGATIAGSDISFDPAITALSAGESQATSISIPLPDDMPAGVYEGAITLESLNAGKKTIPLTVRVLGSITIEKQTDFPVTKRFKFEGTLGSFDLKSGESREFGELLPGDYVVEELDTLGWSLEQIDCSSTNVTIESNRITIHLTAAEDIDCTFVNERTASQRLYINPNRRNAVLQGEGGPFLAQRQDVVVNELGTDIWALFFDGSIHGLNKNMTSLAFYDDGLCATGPALLMTFNGIQKLPGFEANPQDVAAFCPDAAGDYNGTGTWTMFFDGSDVGLTSRGEIIDALEMRPDGRMIISTKGNFKVPLAEPSVILKGRKNDLLLFTPSQYGPDTAGTWEMYLDHLSVQGLGPENIVSSYQEGDDIYLSFWSRWTVGGLRGDRNDIVIVHDDYSVELFWDGEAYGYPYRVHGIHID